VWVGGVGGGGGGWGGGGGGGVGGGGGGGGGVGAYARVVYWDGALLMAATACCVGVKWADGKGKGWRWVA